MSPYFVVSNCSNILEVGPATFLFLTERALVAVGVLCFEVLEFASVSMRDFVEEWRVED
jgi:hypothetical protein